MVFDAAPSPAAVLGIHTEEGLGRRGLCRGGLVAQPGLLDRVIGFSHAAQDPVGDREQQRPQLLELLGPGQSRQLSSLKPSRHVG